MNSDELLAELDVFSPDFKEKLAAFVDQRTLEATDAINDKIENYLDHSGISTDQINSLDDFVDGRISDYMDDYSPSVDAGDVYNLKSKIIEVVESDMSFSISVSS